LDGLPEGEKKGMARAYRLQRLSADLLPGWRVGQCGLQAIQFGMATVTRNGRGSHGIAGVRRCGSGWVCPVCAPKIAVRRVAEIGAAVTEWHGRGGHCLLLTLTVQHNAGDKLDDLMQILAGAQRRLWSGRAAQTRAKKYGIAGQIRNTEVTWGAGSGWHPHSHVLVFVGEHVTDGGAALIAELKSKWVWAVTAAGGYASGEHGLTGQRVQRHEERLAAAGRKLEKLAAQKETLDAALVAAYFGKSADLPTPAELVKGQWGAAHELSFTHMKVAKSERYSPWALLIAAGSRVTVAADDVDGRRARDADGAHAARLWQEFADATKGRVLIRWTKGLRALLALDEEATDEQLAEAADEGTRPVAMIHIEYWRWLVLRGRAVEMLAYLDALAVPDEVVQDTLDDWLRGVLGPLAAE
jgi:hypothetical protein